MKSLQQLQINWWKQENREKVLQYHRDYYEKMKSKGLWKYKPVAPEDRKRMRGRQPKSGPDIARGRRDIKHLENYKFKRLDNFNHNGVANKRCGRKLGSTNKPKEPLTIEKTVGKFIVEFS